MLSIKKISFFGLTVATLFFSETALAQSKKIKTTDKSRTTSIINTVKSIGVYRCRAYFSGNGLYVKTQDYSGPDINFLMKEIDSVSNGAIVTIDELRFISGDGKVTFFDKIPYTFNKPKDTVKFKSQAVLQVDKLKSYNFVSGTIYFAGFGHPNVSSAKANDTAKLYKYYDRSGPGTTITLDNCIYKNTSGSLSSPLNKSIKLE